MITTVVPMGTMQILPEPTVNPDTVGSINTQLETSGHNTQNPLITSMIASPTSIIEPSSTTLVQAPLDTMASAADDIFAAPIATDAPPFPQRSDHPAPRLGIQQTAPISTNKFFQNLFLGTQASGAWLHPYSIAWAKGSGVTGSWGVAISHIDSNQLALGPTNAYGAVDYFINPVGIQSFVLSADSLGSSTNLTTANITDMSAVLQLRPNAAAAPAITFPLVQGSAFVTALYQNATPVIQTGVFFQTVTTVNSQPRPGVTKYKILLNDNKVWYLYATSNDGSTLTLEVVNNGLMRANATFTGTIQIAKDPTNGGAGETLYDATCGSYATGVSISGTSAGMTGSYTFSFSRAGLSGSSLLMFALPHHVESFDNTTAAAAQTALQLRTTTKGNATAVLADSWTMVEGRLPVSMTFMPWTAEQGTKSTLSAAAAAKVLAVAQSELSQDISSQTNLNSMYYSGKVSRSLTNRIQHYMIIVVNDIFIGFCKIRPDSRRGQRHAG